MRPEGQNVADSFSGKSDILFFAALPPAGEEFAPDGKAAVAVTLRVAVDCGERAGPLWDPARVRQQNHPEILKISVGFSDVRAEERRLTQRGAAQSPLVEPVGLRLCSKLHKVQVKSKFIVATSA